MMTRQEVREIDGVNCNNNNNCYYYYYYYCYYYYYKHLYSAYTEALYPLHNIHMIVKNKNEKNEI